MSKQQQHQDWEPVIFNKKSAAKTAPAATTPTSSSSLSSIGIYAAASDDDVKKTKYVSKNTSLAVSVARCEKKNDTKGIGTKMQFRGFNYF